MPSDSRRTTTAVKNNHHGLQPQEPDHLPCPRCNSTNTKFCYYNNYNFSQPRHFCKSCRRYWTQGGTLRDIPVGGATRKNPKRSRVTSTSRLEYRSILPPAAVTAPVLMSFTGAPPCGSFTSLLSSAHCSGILGPEICGVDQDVSFGLRRTVWPFSGIAGVGGGGGVGYSGGGGGGSTWQLESADGGGECFVLPDLAISTTQGNAMKIE